MNKLFLILFVTILQCGLAVAQESNNQNINVVILGDSNTWLGGDDCSKPKGWNTHFKSFFNPASCVSYARSGATWTNTVLTVRNTDEKVGTITDNNVIFNQVCRLVDACSDSAQIVPDLILIACGTNDGWFQKKRPNLFSKTVDEVFADSSEIKDKPVNEMLTFAESVRYNCEILKSEFPDCRIILMSPLQSTAVAMSTINKIGDILEECGKYLQISVLRQDKICCVKSSDEKVKKLNTYDGTHTSERGAKLNGEIIATEVENLLK